jgi:two-component system sensor histidine kinase YesM
MGKTRTFRQQLRMAFFLACFVPLTVYLVVVLNVFRLALARSAAQNAQTELAAADSELQRLFTSCETVMEHLAGQPTIRAALRAREEASEQQTNETLYTAAASLLTQADFAIYDLDGTRLYATVETSSEKQLPTNWGLLRAAQQSEGVVYRGMAQDSTTATGRMQLALAVRPEGAAGQTLGYIVVSLTQAHLRRCLTTDDADDSILLLDRFWGEVYLPTTLRDSDLAAQLRLRLLSGQTLRQTGESGNVLYTVRCNAASGFYLVLQQTAPMTDGSMQLLYGITALAVLLCIGLGVLVSRRVERRLIEPIRQLNEAMAGVENGSLQQLDVQLPVTGTDELSQLTGRFNRMTARLKTSWETSLRQQKELSEAKSRLLQAQLNPHFLYNTLDTIKWQGKLHQVPEVATIAADLAKILRHAISEREFVTLDEELELLERYVEIQQMRFAGRFGYTVRVDPGLRELRVPKLILQPLVENAILHGLEEKENGHICVTARQAGNTALLTVEDDGDGRTADEYRVYLQTLRESGQAQRGGRHLGLYNVDAILRLNYGPQSGLEFLAPRAGHGTCVLIRLPLDRMPQEEP